VAGGNVFICEINSAFTGFVFSTEMGGGNSSRTAIAIDSADYVYIAGDVGPNSFFPTTPGAFQSARPALSSSPAFVAVLDPYGGRIYSTYFGGSNGATQPASIAVHNGSIYVAGRTSSSNLPGAPLLTPNPTAGFVVKFAPQLNAISYTQLLGASVNGVAVYQRYSALQTTYPQVYAAGMRYNGGLTGQYEDAFVVKLDETPQSPTPSRCCAIAQ